MMKSQIAGLIVAAVSSVFPIVSEAAPVLVDLDLISSRCNRMGFQ